MGIAKTLSENKLAAYLIGAIIVTGGGWLIANTDWPWKVNQEEILENVVHLEDHDLKFTGVDVIAQGIESSLININSKLEQFVTVRTSAEAAAQVTVGPGIKINRRGRISGYEYFAKKMEITNIGHPDHPSITVAITDETFENDDRDLIIKVGRDLATRLEVPQEQWFFKVSVRKVE